MKILVSYTCRVILLLAQSVPSNTSMVWLIAFAPQKPPLWNPRPLNYNSYKSYEVFHIFKNILKGKKNHRIHSNNYKKNKIQWIIFFSKGYFPLCLISTFNIPETNRVLDLRSNFPDVKAVNYSEVELCHTIPCWNPAMEQINGFGIPNLHISL